MKTSVDWLRFRTKTGPFETLEAMRPMFGSASDLVELRTGIKPQDGWQFAAEILVAGDISLGRVDYGGESQREWVRVNLTGEGCGWVQDWTAAEALVGKLREAEIRRLDIALTTYEGEVTHEMVIEAHGRRRFSSGGRQPHYRVIGGSDPRAGRTIYVGKREGSDKMLRCYEKGFEMLQQVPETMRRDVTHINGHEVAKIYRVELELKAETKFIPWSALMDRDEVFAGAYPFCADLLPQAAHIRLQTLPDFKPRVALETALDNCRRAYGGILRAARMAHGDAEALKILDRVSSEKPSRALIEAGVLTVSHS